MIKRIYIDSSVFGGYFDKEFSIDTLPFFEQILEKNIIVLISEVLEFELLKAPQFVKNLYNSLPKELVEYVELNVEVRDLANKYIEEGVVGKTSKADCQHIALATIYKAEILASWNFKHIVNLDRIRGYNLINLREGYQIIEIKSPNKIFNHEKENKGL